MCIRRIDFFFINFLFNCELRTVTNNNNHLFYYLGKCVILSDKCEWMAMWWLVFVWLWALSFLYLMSSLPAFVHRIQSNDILKSIRMQSGSFCRFSKPNGNESKYPEKRNFPKMDSDVNFSVFFCSPFSFLVAIDT